MRVADVADLLALLNGLLPKLQEIDARKGKALLAAQYTAIHAFVSEVKAMSLTDKSVQITLTASGFVNSAYPAGNPPAPTWAAIPNFLLKPEGTGFTANLRTLYLTADPAALISLVGSPPSGWSLSTDTLTYSGTGQGSASIKARATFAGVTTDSNTFTVQSVAVPSTDTQAPNQPIWLPPSSVTTTTLTLNWLAAADPFKTGETSAGMKDYDFKTNGVHTSYVTTSAGLSLQMTGSAIGGATGSSTQTGTGLALSTSGDSLYDTTDKAYFHGGVVTLNTLTKVGAYVGAFSSVQTFSKVTAGFRKNRTAISQFAHMVCFPTEGGWGINLEYRLTDGGAGAQATHTSSAQPPLWMWCQENASGGFDGYYTLDGKTAIYHASTPAFSMGSSVEAGFTICSSQTGLTVSCTLAQIFVQNTANLSLALTSLTAGTSYGPFTLTPRDNAGTPNSGTASVALTTSTASAAVSTGNFPRTAAWRGGAPDWIGNTAIINQLANNHDVILIDYFHGFTGAASSVALLNAGTKHPAVYKYVNAESVGPPGTGIYDQILWPIVDPTNWVLKNPSYLGGTGTRVGSWFGGGQLSMDVTSLGIAYSGQSNRTWMQFYPDYIVDAWKRNAYGTIGGAVTTINFHIDNFGVNQRVAGGFADFRKTGSAQAEGSVADITQAGYASMVTRLRANANFGGYIGGNVDFSSSCPTPYVGLLDYVFDENVFASHGYDDANYGWAVEMSAGWVAWVTRYRVRLQALRSDGPKHLLLTCFIRNNTSYQEFRYCLCTALVDDGYLCLTPFQYSSSSGDYGHPVFPEMQINMGQRTTAKPAANSLQVWRSDFDNHIALVKPGGLGATTVSLGGTFYVLRGTAAAWLTPGAAVTSITFPSNSNTLGDGLILSRTPT